MMAQPFAPPGMGPHPGMPHGHPMGVPHPGAGHMGGQPGPMMQGMHPGVSGPQVTQGPMVSGMPPGAGTPAPMQNQMAAMAHMAPQQHMFPGQNPQMNLGQMQLNQQAAIMRQRMMMQQHGMQMNMPNGPPFNQAQLNQMKMGMPIQHPQHMAQLQANQQQVQFQQQQQQQQRMMAQQAAAQQQAAFQRAQNQQAAAAQQMQMSRSQEPTTQPPQPHSTPAPQNQPAPPQPQPNQQPPAQPPAQQQPPQAQPKPQPQPPQNNQQGTPQPQVKPDGPEEEPQIKQQELANPIMMQDIPKQQQNDFTGQCILQLVQYQDNLANPERPDDILYWEEIIQKYFSEFGSIRQQLYNNKLGADKSFQLQYASLARFYYLHFTNGIKQILMQSFDHNQSKLPNGGIHIWSTKASLTYVFKNDIRVTTQGSLKVSFDEMNKIEHLFVATSGWSEYIPRSILHPSSPDQSKNSPKLSKNQKKGQQRPQGSPMLPNSPVSDFGLPSLIVQFLEIAEVMTAMGPLMDYFHAHPGTGPREALRMINQNNQQLQMARAQQNANAANAMAMNGQVQFPNQRAMNMQVPHQFQSPALQHLGLPQAQGSPHMGGPNHTPSPAHNPQGGIAMIQQMSAQGSNLSGSQGPSTTTSPNVSNKKRRQSAVKMEEDNQLGNPGDGNKVKPSPRIGGKRQKGPA